MSSSSLPQYNNIPFSSSPAYCFLPSAQIDLHSHFAPDDLLVPSFFDLPVFHDSTAYSPPADFLARPRRTSGIPPERVYPHKLAAWFYASDSSLPFVYEDARDLYFCIRIPFAYLSHIFSGDQAVPVASRKAHVLSM